MTTTEKHGMMTMSNTHATPAAERTAQDKAAYLEELYERGATIAKHGDDTQFALGDIAMEIDKIYGESNVKEFARRVKRSRSSVYEYMAVCQYYNPDLRTMLMDNPVMSYSHLKLAMKAATVDKALLWLNIAIDNTWSVDQLSRALVADKTGEHLTKLATVDVIVRDIDIGLERIRKAANEYGETSQMRLTISWVTTEKDGNE